MPDLRERHLFQAPAFQLVSYPMLPGMVRKARQPGLETRSPPEGPSPGVQRSAGEPAIKGSALDATQRPRYATRLKRRSDGVRWLDLASPETRQGSGALTSDFNESIKLALRLDPAMLIPSRSRAPGVSTRAELRTLDLRV